MESKWVRYLWAKRGVAKEEKLSIFSPALCPHSPLSLSMIILIDVTSSSSILYCSNSEHWSQKCSQSGNIHSIILNVYVDRQSLKNFPFLLFLCKLDKNLMLFLFPWKLVRNQFHTGTDELHDLHTGKDWFPDQGIWPYPIHNEGQVLSRFNASVS